MRSAERELARARLCSGEGHDSFDAYYASIDGDPNSAEAQHAVRQIAAIAGDCLDEASVAQLLRWLVERHTGTASAAMASFELSSLHAGQAVDIHAARDLIRVARQFPDSDAATLAAAALRRWIPGLVAKLHDLQRRGHHDEVVAHLCQLAPYLDELDAEALSSAVRLAVSSVRYCPERTGDLRSALDALLTSPSFEGVDQRAVLQEASLVLASRVGDEDDASEARRRLVETKPDSPAGAQAALALGDEYLSANRPEEALRAYLAASRAGHHLSAEDRLAARFGEAAALEALGRDEEAAFHYQAVVALAPDSDAAVRAQRALERLRRGTTAWD
jgi:tetratricopeptide (TPR) repeat protein